MVISKQTNRRANIRVGDIKFKQVNNIRYLGCQINNNADSHSEISCRIEQARSAFKKLNRVLCSRDLRISLRIQLLRCYVFSVLLYGVEAWTLNNRV